MLCLFLSFCLHWVSFIYFCLVQSSCYSVYTLFYLQKKGKIKTVMLKGCNHWRCVCTVSLRCLFQIKFYKILPRLLVPWMLLCIIYISFAISMHLCNTLYIEIHHFRKCSFPSSWKFNLNFKIFKNYNAYDFLLNSETNQRYVKSLATACQSCISIQL